MDQKNINKKKFKKVFYLYFPRLVNYATQFLNERQAAEDIVQDVFIQVWKNSRQEFLAEKIAPYLFTLVRNKCLNELKHRAVKDKYIIEQSKLPAEELYHISFQVDEGFESLHDKLLQELEQVLQKMPERCQEAFRLKWFGGKKIREIAEIMEISTTAVDKHLARGLKIARNNLSPGMFVFFTTSISLSANK